MKYRAEIDGLRALAVLPVILFHAGFEWFSGGFIGVDVFFVISGYLITTIIISEMAEGRFSLVNFYERRARRILPALFFVMIVCIPFAFTPSDLIDFGQSLIAVSTFSSNFLFWFESGYFDTAAELKPMLHTWSLAVEEQYYIIFPIFLMLSWHFGIRAILILLSLIFIVSLAAAHWGALNKPSATFFLLPTRAWELLVGVFAAFYLKYNTFFKSQLLNQVFSILGISMIIFSIIIFDKSTPFPSLYALIPTVGTLLLILSAVPKTLIYSLLSFKPIVGIGLISYSAYLWHQPLLAFARHRLLGEVSELLLLFLCLLSLVIACFSWQFIEKPFRNKKIVTRKNIFIISILSMISFSLLGISSQLTQGYKERVNFSDELLASFKRPSSDNCYGTPFNHSSEHWGCNLGADKDKIDFILFGDSHSLSLKSIVNDLAKQKGIKVFFTGTSGCIPFLGVFPNRNDQHENNCNILNTRIYNFAKQENVKGIILSARWSYYTFGDYNFRGSQLISNNKDGPFTLQHSIQTFSEAFNTTIKKYNEIDVPIHLISQPPHQIHSPESIYFKATKGLIDIESVSVSRTKFNQLNDIPQSTFITHSHTFNFYDITDLFCDENQCQIGNNNKSFYYDDNHLSIFGAERLTGIIESIFAGN